MDRQGFPEIPSGFVREIESYGSPLTQGLAAALDGEPSVAVRVNPAKGVPDGKWDATRPVPWCAEGFYLPERPLFTADPHLHQGRYYVQDASSMIIARVVAGLADGRPVSYLDACAAPGGKTTAALSALPPGSVAVANEFDRKRHVILCENLAKWGIPATVTQGSVGRFGSYPASFDIVAADVPCSGEGMMRKDAEARRQWTPALTAQCASLQREIIADLWPAIRPGGYLIYSTCTFNRHENEENVEWIINTLGGETVMPQPIDPSWGIAPGIGTDAWCMRFMPHRLDGEGLFMAIIRKSYGAIGKQTRPARGQTLRHDRRYDRCREWIASPEAIISPEGNRLLAYLPCALPAALWPRIELGEIKGKDIVPSQQLAMSTLLNAGLFNSCDISGPTAVAFLRREAVGIDAPRGFVLLKFDGLPLGWVKNLGNRANNLYPQEWRIRMSL